MPSLARNSAARFTADVAGLVFGTAAGIITARWLGPAGKGLFAAITFLAGLCCQVVILGLGDSAIVAIGRKRNSVREVLQTSVAMLIPAALVGVLVLWAASRLEFRQSWAFASAAVLIAIVWLPINLLNQIVSNVINAEERLVFTSGLLTLSSALILASTWVFVAVLEGGVSGALWASIVGVGTSALIASASLIRRGGSFLPRIETAYLRFALSFGPKVQVSNLLVTAAARFDLLLVYALASQGAAGQYSVALTVGALTTMLPFALINASFPRIAGVTDGEAAQLALRLNRITLAAATLAAVAIGVVSPFLIPLAFGKPYAPAVVPALVLLAAGIAASSQYMLARARAARGEPALLLKSFALNTVVMILFDLLLIPRWDVTGAAIASALGSVAGFVVSVAGTMRAAGRPVAISELLPGWAELRDLAQAPGRMLPGRAPAEVAARSAE